MVGIWILFMFGNFVSCVEQMKMMFNNNSVLTHLKTSDDPLIDINTGIVLIPVGTYIHRDEYQPVVSFMPINDEECLLLISTYKNSKICLINNKTRRKRIIDLAKWIYSTFRKGERLIYGNGNAKQINLIAQQARANQISSVNNSGQIFVISDQNVELAHVVETVVTELTQVEDEMKSGTLNGQARSLITRILYNMQRLHSNILVKSVTDIENNEHNVDFLTSEQKLVLYQQLFSKNPSITSLNMSMASLLKHLIYEQNIDFVQQNVSNQKNETEPAIIVQLRISTTFALPTNIDNNAFHVFEVHCLPFFVQNVGHETTEVPMFIGINVKTNKFIELYKEDMKMFLCSRTNGLLLCRHRLGIMDNVNNLCLRSLFKSNVTYDNHEHCSSRQLLKDTFRVYKLSMNTFIFGINRKISCTITNSTSKYIIQIEPLSLITIPCENHLRCDNYVLESEDISCSSSGSNNVYVLSNGTVITHDIQQGNLSIYKTRNYTKLDIKRLHKLVMEMADTREKAKQIYDIARKVSVFNLKMNTETAITASFISQMVVFLVSVIGIIILVKKTLLCVPSIV
ncbi:unnamed protein product [Didymodactylos carnosus]|uniref:Envelope fusion protein n=1 Tax=Didymodactylos carnosus TaxID=1234261 RepID=A0A814MHH6_9BILA|nr:unnamed protein product [Didymodactylos carnosus]CAF3844245.1 unnamed protein product [Didymodactylos carnosus]